MAGTLAMQIEIQSIPSIGDTISLTLGTNVLTYTWVALRTVGYQITIGSTIEEAASNFLTAFRADSGGFIGASSFNSNTVTLAINNSDPRLFNDGSATGNYLVSFFYFNPSQNIYVSGLNNLMYINNDMLVTLNSTGDIGYFILSFTNLSNGNITTSNITAHQGLDGLATINLSPIIKGLFRTPIHSLSPSLSSDQVGSDLIKIDIKHSSGGVERVLRRRFIRGGIKTNRTNISAVSGSFLYPVELIPYWGAYPFGISYLNSDGVIKYITSISNVPVERLDNRRITNCNPIYIKFLNQLGGYSFWLFDGYGKNTSGKNLGSFIEYNNRPTGVNPVSNLDYTDIGDLGNISDSKIYASSKIPSNYLPLIEDLIISPEVYIYTPEEGYTRVTCANNNITQEPSKRAYNLKINFDFNYRFNPSVLWSN